MTTTLRGSVFVYLIGCQNETIYTGITNDMDRRLDQHITGNGGAVYTSKHGVKKLLGCFECASRSEATKIESFIKKNLTHKEKIVLAHYWNEEPESYKPYPYSIWSKHFAY